MKQFATLALATLIGILSASAGAENPLPPDWRPDLELVKERLEQEFEGAGQQGVNLLTGRIFEIRDAQLGLVYLELYAVLSAKEQRALKAEQVKWLKFRDDEVDHVTPKDGERGTIAPMEENERAIEVTEKRTKELSARLKQK